MDIYLDQPRVPTWDLADRMRKSLREAGIGVAEMSDFLEVSRNTISNWINGHNRPKPRDIRLWAVRCGVPFEWLRDGTETVPADSAGTERVRRQGLEPRTRWLRACTRRDLAVAA